MYDEKAVALQDFVLALAIRVVALEGRYFNACPVCKRDTGQQADPDLFKPEVGVARKVLFVSCPHCGVRLVMCSDDGPRWQVAYDDVRAKEG